jgi:hypothetical protein
MAMYKTKAFSTPLAVDIPTMMKTSENLTGSALTYGISVVDWL